MKILDRYIARELIGPFLFGVAAFTLIFISGQYLFKLTSMVARGASLPPVSGRSFVVQDYANGELEHVVIAGGFDFAARRLDQVTYLQYKGKSHSERHAVLLVEAQRAYWDPEQRDRWVFENGYTYWLEPEHSANSGSPTDRYSGRLSFTRESLYLNKTPQQIVAEGKDSEEMSF